MCELTMRAKAGGARGRWNSVQRTRRKEERGTLNRRWPGGAASGSSEASSRSVEQGTQLTAWWGMATPRLRCCTSPWSRTVPYGGLVLAPNIWAVVRNWFWKVFEASQLKMLVFWLNGLLGRAEFGQWPWCRVCIHLCSGKVSGLWCSGL